MSLRDIHRGDAKRSSKCFHVLRRANSPNNIYNYTVSADDVIAQDDGALNRQRSVPRLFR